MADSLSGEDFSWVRPCKVLLFRDVQKIEPHQVLFLDNRPGGEHLYEAEVTDLSSHIREGTPHPVLEGFRKKGRSGIDVAEDEEVREALFGRGGKPPAQAELERVIEYGLPRGDFRDTAKVAEWIGTINGYADFQSLGLRPLELVVAHAESQLDVIARILTVGGVRPAGVILSGSPKMLSEVFETPVIQKTLVLIRHCLEEGVPLLGICFGFHLLAYARFGQLTEWLMVPEGAQYEWYHALREHTPCEPGRRRMIFGSRKFKRRNEARGHPLLVRVGGTFGLKVHSQCLHREMEGIPDQAVLATSNRYFTPDESMAKLSKMIRQEVIEVIAAGDLAFGAQLHPELSPELLWVLDTLSRLSKCSRAGDAELRSYSPRALESS